MGYLSHATTYRVLGNFLFVSALAARPTVALAQGSDASAAQAVATAFLNAKQAGDWKAAAGFLDLAPLEQHRRSVVERERMRRSRRSITVEEYMRMDPAMPRAVAEYQVRRMNDRRASTNALEQEFGVGTADSLLALPIENVAERLLQRHDQRWLYREAMRMSGCGEDTTGIPGMPVTRVHTVGTVVDDSIAYTLYDEVDETRGVMRPVALNEDPMYTAPVRILRLRRDRGSWWVIPGSDMTGGVDMAMSCQRVVVPKKPQ
jgi:hypothetical protein